MSGFIGRYVVKRLAATGYVVRVAVRDPERAMFLRPMGRVGQIVPLFADIGADATLSRAIEGASVVVNLVGILAERRAGDFQRLQAEGCRAGSQARRRGRCVAPGPDVGDRGVGAEPVEIRAQQGGGEALVRNAF